jgi:hypothetical protein
MNGLKWMRTTVAMMVLVPLLAAAGNWKLSIGVSYRDFDDVDFGKIRNLGIRNLRLLLEDGQATEFSNDLIENIQAGWVQIVDVDNISSGYRGSDESVDSSDSFAPVISAETPVWTSDDGKLTLNFVTNLQWYNVDVGGDSSYSATATATEHQYWVQNGVLAPRPSGDGTPYGDLSLSGKAHTSFEMDLYEIDLGLKLLFSLQEKLDCFVAGGPSLSIVDMDSSVSETIRWSAPGDSGTVAHERHSDSDTDLIFGGYISAGAEYWFNEQFGISLEGRYDMAIDDAETGQASLDLDGFSGQAKFMMRF